MRGLDPTLPRDGTDLINTRSRDAYRWLLWSNHLSGMRSVPLRGSVGSSIHITELSRRSPKGDR